MFIHFQLYRIARFIIQSLPHPVQHPCAIIHCPPHRANPSAPACPGTRPPSPRPCGCPWTTLPACPRTPCCSWPLGHILSTYLVDHCPPPKDRSFSPKLTTSLSTYLQRGPFPWSLNTPLVLDTSQVNLVLASLAKWIMFLMLSRTS